MVRANWKNTGGNGASHFSFAHFIDLFHSPVLSLCKIPSKVSIINKAPHCQMTLPSFLWILVETAEFSTSYFQQSLPIVGDEDS